MDERLVYIHTAGELVSVQSVLVGKSHNEHSVVICPSRGVRVCKVRKHLYVHVGKVASLPLLWVVPVDVNNAMLYLHHPVRVLEAGAHDLQPVRVVPEQVSRCELLELLAGLLDVVVVVDDVVGERIEHVPGMVPLAPVAEGEWLDDGHGEQ